MGVQARRCLKPADVDECLEWLVSGSGDGPALLDVVTDKKIPVLPMVPAGKALHEFLIYDEGQCHVYYSPILLTSIAAKEKGRRALMFKRSGH